MHAEDKQISIRVGYTALVIVGIMIGLIIIANIIA